MKRDEKLLTTPTTLYTETGLSQNPHSEKSRLSGFYRRGCISWSVFNGVIGRHLKE
jgi:hypothetical protein